jgi:hypothetical protein
MLERITVTGEESNQYFIHNNGLAKEWEKLADEYKGKITGRVNGQILEFNLKIEIDDVKVNIHVISQLSNKHTGTLYDNGLLMTKNTIIEIFPIKTSSGNWRIIKANKLAEWWHNLTAFSTPLAFDPKYLLVSKQRVNTTDLLSNNEFNGLGNISDLRRIVKKGTSITIEYHNALGTGAAMKAINSLIKIK